MTLRLVTLNRIAAAMLLAFLGGCGGGGVYKEEAFKPESPYQRTVPHSEVKACEAAQLALLSQGYRIESADAVSVHAKKDFQPDDEENVTIDFAVICKSVAGGSTIFANAIETTYQLKKISGGASLSVPGAGSIAMPWSKSADSLVKVASKTVSEEKFYRKFFDLLNTYLPRPEVSK